MKHKLNTNDDGFSEGMEIYETQDRPPPIVAKKRDPGILDPELFLAQIRKVEARLGKLAKIRKVETD